ncbi:hypothetical protein H2200_007584 [Cladophialophora chaetospira]|uniref:Peptidase A1 domain-containing protein n=1 Tax=Cladophialophora chaetospira TaxID=386627 RepID=A0AA38X650_9EURO|nr:hypothetical protein H2200_007584 [Cladophialophora chaetospira]
MHQRWLSLPLLSGAVSAFYPYQPDDGGNDNSKRFIPLDIEPKPQDNTGVVTLDIKKLVTRSNIFPVVNSTAPNAPNAMAINQDGNDYTYFSTMKFGSSQQEMYMLIDSGSANTWVMGSNCKSNACQTHNLFGSEESSTLKTTTQKWSMTYGTGEVDGVVATDSVQLANYTLSMSFGLASTASDDFNNYPMDGILGLGRSTAAINSPTIMQVLDSQGHLSSNVVGIHLQRSSDGTHDGQITIGGVDASMFAGKLSYAKTIATDSWQVAADDAGVNGKAVGFKGKTAIIDTGTSYILMPPDDAAALLQLIPGSSQNGELYTVPCSSSANVFITIAGVKYSVSPKDYVGKQSGSGCQSNIIGHQAFGPDDWILGDVFLKNVYTVLDFDNARVGFGTKSGAVAGGGSSTTSTSATGAASSSAPGSSGTGGPSSTTKPASSGTSPATTFSTASTRTSSSTSTRSGAAATSSTGSSDSDPFSQAGDTGSSPSSSASASGAAETRPSFLLPMMAVAFVVGFFL